MGTFSCSNPESGNLLYDLVRVGKMGTTAPFVPATFASRALPKIQETAKNYMEPEIISMKKRTYGGTEVEQRRFDMKKLAEMPKARAGWAPRRDGAQGKHCPHWTAASGLSV
jgi:hypothetical protein